MKNNIITISKLAAAFSKIYNGIEKAQLNELDKELVKIYPTDQSQVLLSTDYNEEENSVGLSIYVSEPITDANLQKKEFDKLMSEYLTLADIEKLTNVFECIELMERKQGDKYDIDFIPVFYTKEINKYDLHIRITKK